MFYLNRLAEYFYYYQNDELGHLMGDGECGGGVWAVSQPHWRVQGQQWEGFQVKAMDRLFIYCLHGLQIKDDSAKWYAAIRTCSCLWISGVKPSVFFEIMWFSAPAHLPAEKRVLNSSESVFVNVYGAQESILRKKIRRNRFHESIPPTYVAWRAGTSNRVFVPAARLGIDSWAP